MIPVGYIICVYNSLIQFKTQFTIIEKKYDKISPPPEAYLDN